MTWRAVSARPYCGIYLRHCVLAARSLGGAVQVGPIEPRLKLLGTKRLKL